MALVTKGFKDILSFSRNSEKTYFDKDGVLQTAAVNEPAFTHDPVTGESLGLSVHEQRTNLIYPSNNFLGWSGSSSFSANTVTGGFRGIDYQEVTQNVDGILFRTVISQGGFHTYSIWVGDIINSTTGNDWSFALRDGTATVNLATARKMLDGTWLFAGSAKIVQSIGRWDKIELTAEIPSGNDIIVYSNFDGNAGDTLEMQQGQLEQGIFSTPDIFTTTAQVTRQADTCSIDSIDTSEWWNPSEGTFVVDIESSVEFYDKNMVLLAITDGTTENLYQILSEDGNRISLSKRYNGGAFEGFVNTVQLTEKNHRIVFSLRNDGHSISANGGTAVTTTYAEPLPVNLNRLDVFNRLGIGFTSGTIKSIKYKPAAVSGAELQELSKL